MEALSSPPKVAADQNPFPLLPPSSRMSREKDLQMLNLGRAPSTTVLLNNQRRLAQQTGQQGSCWRRYRATWIRMVAMEEGL
jgi:hypothetical protein